MVEQPEEGIGEMVEQPEEGIGAVVRNRLGATPSSFVVIMGPGARHDHRGALLIYM